MPRNTPNPCFKWSNEKYNEDGFEERATFKGDFKNERPLRTAMFLR